MHGVFQNRFLSNLVLTACAAAAAVTTHLAIAQGPSQNDATFTPDPYYVPVQPSLDGPIDGSPDRQPQTTWTPPPLKQSPQTGNRLYQATQRDDTSAVSNQVRSLQNNIIWEPPSTPVEPGFNPAEMTHSAIPKLSAQPNAAPSAIGNSIIRQPTSAASASQVVPNAFAPTTTPDATLQAFARAASLTPAITMNPKPAPVAVAKPKKDAPAYNALPGFKKVATPKTPENQFATAAKSSPATAPAATISPKPPVASPLSSRKRSSSIAGVGATPLNDFSPTNRTATVKRQPAAALPKQPVVSRTKPPVATTQKPAKPTPKIQTTDSGKPADAETFAPTQLLATVGGQPIFMADALLEVNQLIEQHMQGAPDSVKDRERKNLIKRVLPKLVDQKVLYVGAIQSLPEGADLESVVDEAGKEFDDKALPDLMKRAKIDDVADYDAWLRGMGSSLRKQRDTWARDQLTRYFISEQVNANKEVTHQQLLDEYRANEATYRFAAKSKWEQIMVRFDRFKTRDQAREAIAEMGNRLIYGANLSALAKKSSHGFRASEGGQHNWTGKDALVLKEIDKAIFELPIGELSNIIETRDGLHIVRVIDRREAGIKPFTEAQTEIKKRLKNKFRNEAFDEHVAKLRKKVPVEYHTAATESSTFR